MPRFYGGCYITVFTSSGSFAAHIWTITSDLCVFRNVSTLVIVAVLRVKVGSECEWCTVQVIKKHNWYSLSVSVFLLLKCLVDAAVDHHCCIASEGRRVVAPPCPRSTARLQRSPVGRVKSYHSWSSHLFRGRPGRQHPHTFVYCVACTSTECLCWSLAAHLHKVDDSVSMYRCPHCSPSSGPATTQSMHAYCCFALKRLLLNLSEWILLKWITQLNGYHLSGPV